MPFNSRQKQVTMNDDACNRITYKQNLGIRGSMEMGSLRANDGADVMQSGPHSGAYPAHTWPTF